MSVATATTPNKVAKSGVQGTRRPIAGVPDSEVPDTGRSSNGSAGSTSNAGAAHNAGSAHNYMARHLQVLEGLEAVRKRPAMYIGSTDSRGLMHCVWEIIDNSVDEALAGVCDRIDVALLADGSVQVRDNGRGIPVDLEPRTGLSGVEVVFTKLHAGGKFGGGSYTASGGCTGWAPRSSMRCPLAWTSRWTVG